MKPTYLENSIKRMPNETKPITWIGGIRRSPYKVFEDDTTLPEVVFWFDTNTGATMTCEVANPVSAHRFLINSLAQKLMNYHQSHGRFPDTIQVLDPFCAEWIRNIVPLSVTVEILPGHELNRRIQSFVLKLQALEKQEKVTAPVFGFSLEHTQKLVRNLPMFERLVDSIMNDEGSGKCRFDFKGNTTVAPHLREIFWEDPSPLPTLEFTSEPLNSEELKAWGDNPWIAAFLKNAKLPKRSAQGFFLARVIAIGLWGFTQRHWGSSFDGWGKREMEVFLARFGDESTCFSEDSANLAIETMTSFFQWIVTTEHVRANEAGELLEKFHAGRECLREKLTPDPSGYLSPFSPWPEEFCSDLSLNSEKSVADTPIPTIRRLTPKMGRNEPCLCGSGRKYKKCCVLKPALAA